MLRVVSGFCFAGLFMVAESRLNERATNANRGTFLSIYMTVNLSALAAGQQLLNLSDPGDFPLFVLSSVLVSLALVPVALTRSAAPTPIESVRFGLRQLYAVLPLGVVGSLGAGLIQGAFWGMAPLFGQSLGLSTAGIASFIRPTGEIFVAAFEGLSRLSRTALQRRIDRVAFRDTLMLAILAARPLRLRNFAGIRIGRHLVREGDVRVLTFPAEEVKNRRPLEHAVPDSVVPFLETYLERIRPSFLKGAASDALWLGFEGRPLTPHSIYGRIMLVGERLLGVAINPHLLRDCAAISLATV